MCSAMAKHDTPPQRIATVWETICFHRCNLTYPLLLQSGSIAN
jgi:hypothetical protein